MKGIPNQILKFKYYNHLNQISIINTNNILHRLIPIFLTYYLGFNLINFLDQCCIKMFILIYFVQSDFFRHRISK